MLRHIVTWKMNGQTADLRQQQTEEVAKALRELKGVVPSVQELAVYANELHADKNWDVVLVADFADSDALDKYNAHPEHQEVVKLISKHAADRAGVDFTV